MIQKTIIEYLQAEYDSGMTQEEIAQKHNLKQPQIQKILSGDRSAAGFNVQTIDKMFPKAVIYLDGVPFSATHSGFGDIAQTASGNISIGQKNFTQNQELQSRIINTDKLSADEKIKFLQFLEGK